MKLRSRGTVVTVVLLVVILALFAFFVLDYTRRVTGVSMLPTLESGDLVVISSVPFDSVHTGDIIVYSPPCAVEDFSVIHRVVAIQPGGLITKGDNNFGTDQADNIAKGPITPDCYEGKVVFVVPYLERVASLPYDANYLIAALIVIIVIVSEIYGRGGEEEEVSSTGAVAAPPAPSPP